MARSKCRRISAGTLIRYRDGVCTFACHHAGCRASYGERERVYPAWVSHVLAATAAEKARAGGGR